MSKKEFLEKVKAQHAQFDPSKEYGAYLVTDSEDGIKVLKEVIWDNVKLCIPEEFHSSVNCPIINHRPAWSITVKDDNYEMLGMKKEDIGRVLDADEKWSVGWLYSPKLARVG